MSRDTSKLTVSGVDGKEFVIIFNDPDSVEADTWITEPMTSGCSAGVVLEAIKPFWQHSTGSDPSVELVCFDSGGVEEDCVTESFFQCTDPVDGVTVVICESCKDVDGATIDCSEEGATTCVDDSAAETTCTVEAASTSPPTYVYTIQTLRSIARDSWSYADVVPTKTASVITLEKPADLGLQSNAPLQGSYFIECYELPTGHDYSDSTVVASSTWGDYKITAMASEYTSTSEYLAFTTAEKELADSLIAA